MELFLEYLKAFVVGGAICAIGQVLIDYTKLTPARILVSFVVAGVILGGLGVYQPLIEFAGAGATVPLTGERAPGGVDRGLHRFFRRHRRRGVLRPVGRPDLQARR